MRTENIFPIQLVAGYLAWALAFGTYVLPWLRAKSRADAFRALATLHSFRFFGLAFLVPGVVAGGLPTEFSAFAAYGDFATAALALSALIAFRVRPVFWTLVVAFNVVGAADLCVDYAHAIQAGLPAHAGALGAMYAIPVLYVPLLMIAHGLAFYWLLRGRNESRPELPAPHAAN